MDQQQNRQSEALFEQLNKNKKKKKRKTLRTVLIVILVIAVALVMVFNHLRQQVEGQFAAMAEEVQSYEVHRGPISTTVTGSGTLAEVGLETVTVPSDVEILEILVQAGDPVTAGKVLATVDMASVMDAMEAIQSELDSLDTQIKNAKNDSVEGYITAGVDGRVKKLYAREGTDVVACMAEHGALALLSLDGYMAVDIETDALKAGDTVTVVRGDGTEISGTVETVKNGVATVLVTDKGPKMEEQVTVTADGTEIGTGSLYIHSPLKITGYAGRVTEVYREENDWVDDYYWIFALEDTGVTVNYDSLLRQRAEKEAELLELLEIYRNGAILATMDGVVSTVDYDPDAPAMQPQTDSNATQSSGYAGMMQMGTSGQTEASAQSSGQDTQLLTIYPNVTMQITISIDEMDILALEVGQTAEITVSSISEETKYTGVVTQIDTTSSQYSAVVELPRSEEMLSGMTAEVDVQIQGVENALLIPVDALHQTSAIYYVYTTYDPETMQYGGRVEVTVGMRNSEFAEITSGLSEGDTVWYTEETDYSWMFGGMNGGVPGGMGGGMPGEFGG